VTVQTIASWRKTARRTLTVMMPTGAVIAGGG
jgi:hypothetical protein